MGSVPALCTGFREADEVQDPFDRMVDEILDGFRGGIKSGNRGSYDRAHLCKCDHCAQVTKMERRFPNSQDQFTSFLQRDVCRPNHQVGTDAGGYSGHCVDGAGEDHHGIDRVGAAGYRSRDVFGMVRVGSELFEVLKFVPGFQEESLFGRTADDQVDLGRVPMVQFL